MFVCVCVAAEENMFSPKNGVNGVYMYAVFGGAVLLVSLPLGVLLGCFCFRIFRIEWIIS